MNYKKLYRILCFVLFGIALLFRLYELEKIPGEWFGDISNVHEYILQIRDGLWPWYFFQSAGPVYHYVIFPLVSILPTVGYDTYKIASVVVSIVGIIVTYFFVGAMFPTSRISYMTIGVMATGYWYLIWSRLGNSQIIIPLLVAVVSWCVFLYHNSRRMVFVYLASGISIVGWFVYPHTYILPISIWLYFFFYFFFTGSLVSQYRRMIIISLITMGGMAIFYWMMQSDRTGNFGPSGYLGAKVLPIFSAPLSETLAIFGRNVVRVVLMLHVRGDGIFRSNIPFHPQLDTVSGIAMLLGIGYILWRKWHKQLLYMFFMMSMLILPSVSPAIPSGEIPNSGRTIAIIPFVYTFVAAGFVALGHTLFMLTRRRWLAISITGIFCIISLVHNYFLYFSLYARGLPDNNLGPSVAIVDYIQTHFPKDIPIYFAHCCWGEAGQPEPKATMYTLGSTQPRSTYERFITSCIDIEGAQALVFLAPTVQRGEEQFYTCRDSYVIHPVMKRNEIIVRLLYLE